MSDRAANLLGAYALMVADRLREAAGMELSSAAVLSALHTFADGASIDDLRRVLGLSHSGGVRIVKRLEGRGLLTRGPDPDDRRAVRLHLTAEGQRLARRVLAGRQAALTTLLAPFGTGEAAELERLLEVGLAEATGSGGDANRICRLCDPDVCGHPGRCPVTQAVVA
jgi:MarR family transcriptional regulator, negative regulator of the multidrug operon emrRAB